MKILNKIRDRGLRLPSRFCSIFFLDGGGTGTQNTKTKKVVNQSFLPSLQTGQNAQFAEFNRGPKSFFPGSTVVPFNPLELESQQTNVNQARNLLPTVAGAQGAANFNLENAQNPGVNPIFQTQIDNQIARLTENFTQSVLPQLRTSSISAGGFGDSRQDLIQGRNARAFGEGTARAAGDITANQFNRDVSAGLQQQQLLPTLANFSLAPGTAIGAVGDEIRGLDEAKLNEKIQRFNFDQGSEQARIDQLLKTTLAGIGTVGTDTEQTSTQTSSNPLQAALGLGSLASTIFGGGSGSDSGGIVGAVKSLLGIGQTTSQIADFLGLEASDIQGLVDTLPELGGAAGAVGNAADFAGNTFDGITGDLLSEGSSGGGLPTLPPNPTTLTSIIDALGLTGGGAGGAAGGFPSFGTGAILDSSAGSGAAAAGGIPSTVVGGGGALGAGPSGAVAQTGLNAGGSAAAGVSGLVVGAGVAAVIAAGVARFKARNAAGKANASANLSSISSGTRVPGAVPEDAIRAEFANASGTSVTQANIEDAVANGLIAFTDKRSGKTFFAMPGLPASLGGNSGAIAHVYDPATGSFGMLDGNNPFQTNEQLVQLMEDSKREQALEKGLPDPKRSAVQLDRQGVPLNNGAQNLVNQFRGGN